MSKSKKRNYIGRIFTAIALLFLALFFVYVCWCNLAKKPVYFGKYAVLHIVSSSMDPEIEMGSYILIEKTNAAVLSEGDVIAFYSRDPALGGGLNTHRIEKVLTKDGESKFITRGDANDAEDAAPVFAKDVAGKYIKPLPFFTSAARFLSHKTAFLLLVVLPASVLMVYCAVHLAKEIKGNRGAKAGESRTAENEKEKR